MAVGGEDSFALKNDGSLWAWGNGYYLGTGDTKDQTNAVQVGTSTNWTKIWAGVIQTVGLQSDGSLWFWGSLDGDGRGTNNFLVPTRISPDTNFLTDACFGYYTMFANGIRRNTLSWGNQAHVYTGASDEVECDADAKLGLKTLAILLFHRLEVFIHFENLSWTKWMAFPLPSSLDILIIAMIMPDRTSPVSRKSSL